MKNIATKLCLSGFVMVLVLTTLVNTLYSQNVGIGEADFTPDASALLELRSTSMGFLLPRMTEAQKNAIVNPAHGLMVIQTDGLAGIWYYDATVPAWYLIQTTGTIIAWGLTGNAGTNPSSNFIGTTDNAALAFRTNNNDQLRLLTNGNFGVGTTSPTQLLEVEDGNLLLSNSAVGTPGQLQFEASSNSGFISSFEAGTQTGNISYVLPTTQGSASTYLLNDGSGNLSWVSLPAASQDWTLLGNSGTTAGTNFLGTIDNVSLSIKTNSTERLRILNTGEVGIGTITPGELLNVENGNLLISNTTDAAGELQFAEPSASGANFTAFKAQAQAGDITYTLPAADGSSGDFLQTDGGGNLTWATGLTSVPFNIITSGTNTQATMTVGSGASLLPGGTGIVQANQFVGSGSQTTAVDLATGEVDGILPVGNGGTGLSALAANSLLYGSGGNPLNALASVANSYLTTDGSGNLQWSTIPTTSIDWALSGNGGTTEGADFLGTTDAQGLAIKTNGADRIRISSTGEVGIGTTSPDATAVLDMQATDKGVLVPRMNLTQRNAIGSPATGLLIYQTDDTAGFYYYNGTSWVLLSTGSNNDWALEGNSSTNPSTNFVGTTDNNALAFRTNNTEQLRLLTSGNFGIGTSTPSQLLEVQDGNLLLSNSAVGTAGQLQFEASGNTGFTSTFKAGAQGVNINYTLPLTPPASDGYHLVSTTAGQMSWEVLPDNNDWKLLGNSGSDSASMFMGTIDGQSVVFKTLNLERMRIYYNGGVDIQDHFSLTNPTGWSTYFVQNPGVAQDLTYTLPMVAGSDGQYLKFTSGGQLVWSSIPGVTGLTFDLIESGTNTQAEMVVSSGASLYPNGTGYIQANRFVGTGSTTYAVDLATSEVDGILPVANGGTGKNSLLSNSLLYGSGSTPMNELTTQNDSYLTTDGSGNLQWSAIASGFHWSVTGNSGTSAGTNFLGTTDGQDLVFKTNNTEQVRLLTTGEFGIGTATPSELFEVEDGNILLSNTGTAGELQFEDASGSGYTSSFKAGTQTADINYTWPEAQGSSGATTYLKNDGTGSLEWTTVVTTGTFILSSPQTLPVWVSNGGDTTINVGSTSYIRFERKTTGGSVKVFLEDGTIAGQIVLLSATNNNTIKLSDSGNMNLVTNSDMSLNTEDTILIVWDGNTWIEISRSNN